MLIEAVKENIFPAKFYFWHQNKFERGENIKLVQLLWYDADNDRDHLKICWWKISIWNVRRQREDEFVWVGPGL